MRFLRMMKAIFNLERSLSGNCDIGIVALYVGLLSFLENEDHIHENEPFYYISGMGGRYFQVCCLLMCLKWSLKGKQWIQLDDQKVQSANRCFLEYAGVPLPF